MRHSVAPTDAPVLCFSHPPSGLTPGGTMHIRTENDGPRVDTAQAQAQRSPKVQLKELSSKFALGAIHNRLLSRFSLAAAGRKASSR